MQVAMLLGLGVMVFFCAIALATRDVYARAFSSDPAVVGAFKSVTLPLALSLLGEHAALQTCCPQADAGMHPCPALSVGGAACCKRRPEEGLPLALCLHAVPVHAQQQQHACR